MPEQTQTKPLSPRLRVDLLQAENMRLFNRVETLEAYLRELVATIDRRGACDCPVSDFAGHKSACVLAIREQAMYHLIHEGKENTHASN